MQIVKLQLPVRTLASLSFSKTSFHKVTMHLRCGEIFNYNFVANFLDREIILKIDLMKLTTKDWWRTFVTHGV